LSISYTHLLKFPLQNLITNYVSGSQRSALLRITNYELRITNYELRITNYELRITNYELRITNYELRITKAVACRRHYYELHPKNGFKAPSLRQAQDKPSRTASW